MIYKKPKGYIIENNDNKLLNYLPFEIKDISINIDIYSVFSIIACQTYFIIYSLCCTYSYEIGFLFLLFAF